MIPAVTPPLAIATATSAPAITSFGFRFGRPGGVPVVGGEAGGGVHCVTGSADERGELS
jgi:hypothetical protein